jgi:hypothetical protein
MINQSNHYPNIALEIVLELPGQSCELFSVHDKNTRFVYNSVKQILLCNGL